jgi:homotetrameric cytidine deaminase
MSGREQRREDGLDHVERAFRAACEARERAHAPYSGFRVGAAVKAKGDDRVFAGCNVENASYGATICAERSAVVRMVSETGKRELELVVVVTEADPPSAPCGVCRQVLSEFGGGDLLVCLGTPSGISVRTTLEELLPRRFDLSTRR